MDLSNTLNLSSSRWAPASIRQQSRSPHPNHFPQQHPSPSSHPHASPAKHGATDTTTSTSTPYQTSLSSAQRTYLSRLTSHTRFTRLLLRLRHKSLLLQVSHHRALKPPHGTTNGVLRDLGPAEAETMFRVDFYEWYVLLERCLIALLETVGIGVGSGYDPAGTSTGARGGFRGEFGLRGRSGGDAATTSHSHSHTNSHTESAAQSLPPSHSGSNDAKGPNETRGGALIGDSHAFSSTGGYAHRFHESVLDALDNPNTPVHTILGIGRVRDFIGIAKEFRNRWKDFDVNIAGQDVAGVGVNGVGYGGVDLEVAIDRKLRRYEALLRDLKLDELIGVILEALERAKRVAEAEVKKVAGEDGVDEGGSDKGAGEWDMEVDLDGEGEGNDVPFEAGVDAMEWD